MLILTFPRIITLAITFAYLRLGGGVTIFILVFTIFLSALPYYKIDRNKGMELKCNTKTFFVGFIKSWFFKVLRTSSFFTDNIPCPS